MLTLKKYRQQIIVDLGSYYTKIFLGEKLVFKERTVVLVSKSKVKCVAFGNDAILRTNEKDLSEAYPIKHGYISNSITTLAYVKHFLDKLKGRVDILNPDFILKVPFGINSIQEHALIKVFNDYGAHSITLKNTYKYIKDTFEFNDEKLTMVVSLGGGINEFFLVKSGEILKYSSSSHGGIDLTKEIQNVLERKFNSEFSFQEIEKLKIELSSALSNTSPEKFHKIVAISGKSFQITAKDIQSEVNKYLATVILGCEKLLAELSKKQVEEVKEQGILLFGGASHLRNIREFLSKVLGIIVY